MCLASGESIDGVAFLSTGEPNVEIATWRIDIGRRKSEGQSDCGLPFCFAEKLAVLWQVVAERGPEHVVGALGAAAGVERAAGAGPEIALEPAYWRPKRKRPLGPL